MGTGRVQGLGGKEGAGLGGREQGTYLCSFEGDTCLRMALRAAGKHSLHHSYGPDFWLMGVVVPAGNILLPQAEPRGPIQHTVCFDRVWA